MKLTITEWNRVLESKKCRVVNLRKELDKITTALNDAILIRDFLAYQINTARANNILEFEDTKFCINRKPARSNKRPYEVIK